MMPGQHIQERRDRVSFPEGISKTELSPALPCNCCRHSTSWELSPSHIILWHLWQYPHWISHSLLQAPEAGTAFTALSAGAAGTQRLLFVKPPSCLKCKALQKPWESTIPALHRAAQRGSLLSSSLPTAGARPSCLH